MINFEEMREALKKETVLPTVVFDYCLSLAYDDEHHNGFDSVMQKFRDTEWVFSRVYSTGFSDGLNSVDM